MTNKSLPIWKSAVLLAKNAAWIRRLAHGASCETPLGTLDVVPPKSCDLRAV